MPSIYDIIETVSARFSYADSLAIVQPFRLDQVYTLDHILLYNDTASIYHVQSLEESIPILPGEFFYVPSHKKVNISFGSSDSSRISADIFLTHYSNYLVPFSSAAAKPSHPYGTYSYISFDLKVLECIDLLSLLDIPAFKITPTEYMVGLYHYILYQNNRPAIAQSALLDHAITILAIEIIRFVFSQKLFFDAFVAKMKYFQDVRILNILTYINNNLEKELSNKVLAELAHISEDYMGQYFKLATKERPQAYVECQRMKKAIYLLQTSSHTVQDIGKKIGLKDTGYFCRRFKTLFGMQPSKVRKKGYMLVLQS